MLILGFSPQNWITKKNGVRTKTIAWQEIENVIDPVVSSHGCELWGIDLLRGKKRPTIRVYIDAIAGATIEDCEKVAKDLNYEEEWEV